MTCGLYEPPSRCWLSRSDYRYKSAATQIPHDAGLAPIRLIVDPTRNRCLRGSELLLLLLLTGKPTGKKPLGRSKG